MKIIVERDDIVKLLLMFVKSKLKFDVDPESATILMSDNIAPVTLLDMEGITFTIKTE